jgi:hypothetical protein
MGAASPPAWFTTDTHPDIIQLYNYTHGLTLEAISLAVVGNDLLFLIVVSTSGQ